MLDLAKSVPVYSLEEKEWLEIIRTTRSRYLCYGDYRELFYSFFFLRRDALGHIERLFGVKSEQIRFRTRVSFEYQVSNGAFSSDLYT